MGTHLGDTSGVAGEKLVPGTGLLSWEAIVDALINHSFPESLDLEIMASPEETPAAYKKGMAALSSCFRGAKA